MKGIDHGHAYSMDGACPRRAEAFLSRLRRAKIGQRHPIAGADLARYAHQASSRDDDRWASDGEPFRAIVSLGFCVQQMFPKLSFPASRRPDRE